MPQIKNMPGTSAGAPQNILGACPDVSPIGKEQDRTQVSLQAPLTQARQPEYSGVRQSKPITSAPDSFIEGRSVALSVPK